MGRLRQSESGMIFLVLRQAQDEENQRLSGFTLSLSKGEVAFPQTPLDERAPEVVTVEL